MRLTALSLMAAGRYGDALGYLKIWHDRTPANSMDADLNSGQAYFALSRPQDTVEAVKPYASILLDAARCLYHRSDGSACCVAQRNRRFGSGVKNDLAAGSQRTGLERNRCDYAAGSALVAMTQAEVAAWL